MRTIARSGWMPILLGLSAIAHGQHHGGGSHGSPGHHGHDGPDAGGGVQVIGGLGYAVGVTSGCGGFSSFGFGVPYYPTPLIVAGPVLFPPAFPMAANPGFGMGQGGGLMLPPPPPQFRMAPAPPRARRANPDRARELVEIGDRSFRGGNTRRAEERYQLAAKADPASPTPHVHLAQVSLVRKDYAAAARHLRSAVEAAQGSGWISTIPDIQSIFSEPGDFARQVAALESHLQATPGDRDGWFVLGVELYLSGRSQPAADAFERLTDRKPDEALAAFLDATSPTRRAQN